MAEPAYIITDECQALMSAVKNKFAGTEHFLCSWHKQATFKRNLTSDGCFQHRSDKYSLLRSYM